ncbi:MAG: MFS transporter [Eggerthellaceae bacterium]|nr:MFS transporter [Eggerthellaceae bacterium]
MSTPDARDITTVDASTSKTVQTDSTQSESNIEQLSSAGHALPKHWLAIVAFMWTGVAISSFVGMATNYAAVWYVTESTESPLALALVYACGFLPMGLLSPLGGVCADRYNRKHIIIACDLFIALSTLVAGISVLLGHVSLPLVMAMMAVCGTGMAFRTPSFNAVMPLLVPARHLLRINTLDGILSSLSMILAPALGILLYTTLGFQSVLFLNTVGALAAVATICAATIPTIRQETAQQQGAWKNLCEGAQALTANKGLLILVGAVTLGMMAYGPIDSMLPLMVSSQFNGDGYMASLVTGVFGVGMLIGSLILMARGNNVKLARTIVLAAGIVGIMAVVAGLLPSTGFIAFTIVMGILAIACAGFGSPLMTLLQKNISEDKIGRVMGFYTSAMGLAVPVGTALGGILAQGVGVASFFAIDGVIILVLTLVLGSIRSVRALDHANDSATQASETNQAA